MTGKCRSGFGTHARGRRKTRNVAGAAALPNSFNWFPADASDRKRGTGRTRPGHDPVCIDGDAAPSPRTRTFRDEGVTAPIRPAPSPRAGVLLRARDIPPNQET